MAPLRNAKHERFVQAFVRGKNAANATACYAEIYGVNEEKARGSASKLQRRANICSRIAELRAKIEEKEEVALDNAAERLGITREWVLGRLKDDISAAEKIGQFGVAVKALDLLGRHVGLFVSTGDTINNVLNIGVQLIDRPPDETYEQWILRRKRELDTKVIEHHTNGANGKGNGKEH